MSAIEWCLVPAGPFTMGSEPGTGAPEPDEAPQHRLACAGFRIARTPVTNAEYRRFVDATSRAAPTHWPSGVVPEGREHHPVTYVSWSDAAAFCAWVGGFLPSEAQWERAARGDDGRAWPWGDETPTREHATFAGTDTSPVALAPRGASPFGVLDLAGNVWEWTASALRPYPYAADDGREDATSPEPRVVRGGSFIHGPHELRCSYRHGMLPGAVDHYVGFRLAATPGARLVLELDMVDVPAGDALLGNDSRVPACPGRAAATRGRRRCRLALRDGRDEPAVRGVRARHRAAAAASLARRGDARRARGASRHPRRLARRDRVLPLALCPSAHRGRVGEGRARHRRPPLPVGRR